MDTHLAAPLYRLTTGDPRKQKKGELRKTWCLTHPFCGLMTAPVLGYPDDSLPFVLQTEASGEGLGRAVLVQVQGGTVAQRAFASRGWSPAETRYPTHKLEFLSLKWAVTDKFYHYLYGRRFLVLIKNNPLNYVMSSSSWMLWASGGYLSWAGLHFLNFNDTVMDV